MIPVSSIEYINVRIRARHARIFGREIYETLMESDNLGAVTTYLLENEWYREDIESALENLGEREGLERGIANHFCRCISMTRSMAEGDMQEHYDTVLTSFDLRNLKTLLVARERRMPFADISSLMLPCTLINREALHEAYDSGDYLTLARAISLASPQAVAALRTTIQESEKNDPPVKIINRLERNVYSSILRNTVMDSGDTAMVKNIIRYEIDLKNIVSALKHVWGGVKDKNIEDTFITGGTISFTILDEIAHAKEMDNALETIESTRFHEAVEKGIIYYAETGFFHEMERFLEEVLFRKALTMKRSDPFGVGPFIAYVWSLFTELTNLRTVINGIAFKTSPGQIKRSLIYV